MPWVESASASFQCRHSSQDTDDVARVLGLLERTRDRLATVFPRTVGNLTVVMHDSSASLLAASPGLGVIWTLTEPSSRRYVTGSVGRRELHVLAPAALARRASRVAGSGQILALTPASLYARRVITECNHELHDANAASQLARTLRWAWVLEGGSRWFSGETAQARVAITRRLHDGRRPSFPPSVRDAPLLGGTVVDMIAREHGELAASQFVTRFHPQGSRAALRKAFSGRDLAHVEGAWRSHLSHLASAG